ncbi:Metallo-dependent phosphatase [Xylariaceae sp. FL0804]|nr:Metallo-dependent phosphatase [Xylariaceae sp. FL0804]
MFGQKQGGLDALLHRPRPSAWQLFLRNPCCFLAQKLYSWRRLTTTSTAAASSSSSTSTSSSSDTHGAGLISVVCISDTHNSQCELPLGDVLIHAGDLTQSGSAAELQAAVDWLARQPHPVKIAVAGNHDLLLDAALDAAARDHDNPASGGGRARRVAARRAIRWGDVRYLQDSAATVTVRGRELKVYGSPRSPRHGDCWAFQYTRSRSDDDDDVWAGSVPDDTDVLVTHGPPRAHLDSASGSGGGARSLGCEHLLRELWRVRPALHVFGHVHAGYGHEGDVRFDALQAAYEQVVLAGGGVGNLLRVVREALLVQLRRSLCFFFFSAQQPPRGVALQAAAHRRHQLVNPSLVGGLRDDERRAPIKVYI